MNKKGFIASSLLYGLLVIFLVVMLSSIAVLANKKLSSDKLKETAIDDVTDNYGSSNLIYIWFDSYYTPYINDNKLIWKDIAHGYEATINGFDSINLNSGKGITLDNNKTITADKVIFQNFISDEKDFSLSIYLNIDSLPCDIGLSSCQFLKLGDITADFVLEDEENNDFKLELCYPKTQVTQNEPSISCIDILSSDYYKEGNLPVTLTIMFQNGVIRAFVDDDKVAEPEDIDVSSGTVDTSSTVPLTIGGFNGTLYNFIIYKGILSDKAVKTNITQNNSRYRINT